jgi:exodeoxyribonuclease III
VVAVDKIGNESYVSNRMSADFERLHDRPFRALTLNIGAAALPRAEAILSWLSQREDDVFVLTETSAGAGSAFLAERLERLGYVVVWRQPINDRGVMLATRLPVRAQLCTDLDVTLPWRIAAVRLDCKPSLSVLGVYVPSRERSPKNVAKKTRFIDSFLGSLEQLTPVIRNRLLIAGDYNAISRRHKPQHQGFIDCEYQLHEELERLGFVAGHELGHPNPSSHPYSWIGRTGNGYLYDYFHLGRTLHDRLTACRYLHGPRRRALSDHAAVSLALG